jgi:hypothetical protein
MSPDYSPDVLEMLGMTLISTREFSQANMEIVEYVLFRKIDLTSFGPYHEYRVEWWPKSDAHPKFHDSVFFTDRKGVQSDWLDDLRRSIGQAVADYAVHAHMDLIPSKG